MIGHEEYVAQLGLDGPPGTVLDVLEQRARREPATHQFTFLDEGEGPYRELSVGQLAAQVEQVAGFLAGEGVRPGDVVVLLLPPDASFVLAMLGTQRAVAVPAAIYPPFSPTRLLEQADRAAGIVRDSGATTVLTCALIQPYARLLAARVPALQRVLCLERALVPPAAAAAPAPALPALPGPEDTAFLQYSSGSTGDPKGAVILHRNLVAQLWLLGSAVPALHEPERRRHEVCVSWLPPYHDMGLVGTIFYPIFWGLPSYLASPVAFIRKPWLWLRWISRFRGTQTVAPNFAYQRCAAKLRERDLEGVDLSSLTVAWNGAEPIPPASLRRFVARFAPYGFSAQAMFPVYGLAENTLCATHPGPGEGAGVDRILRREWEEQGRAVPAGEDAPARAVLELTACGRPGVGTRLRVADEAGRPLPERQRGEICIQGSSLMPGYHRRAPGAEWLPDGWLRTGDLGYLADGRLFVAGRLKEMIIVGGRNVFPHDVEVAVEQVPGVQRSRVVAFGLPDLEKGTEDVVVCAEVDEGVGQDDGGRALRRAIRQAVLDALGLGTGKVVLVPHGWVEKTSSGKLRRTAARERFSKEFKVGDGE